MSGLHHYIIRAESREALIELLGSVRPDLIVQRPNGPGVYPAQVTFPREEMTAGVLDPDTDEYTEAPQPTGMWVCEVRLMEPDAELAAIAIGGTHALV